MLEEILVTAQKRTENLQDVPSSISIFSNERLQQLHATTITDYAAYIPGLIVNSGGGPGQTTITLRGVAPVGPGSVVDDENDVSQQGARATLLWQINETLRCSSAACGNRSIPTTTPPHRSR